MIGTRHRSKMAVVGVVLALLLSGCGSADSAGGGSGLEVTLASIDDGTVNAADIDALLAGNSAAGDWAGTPYRQYFDPNGDTVYTQQGSRNSVGDWRVDKTADRYESAWATNVWEVWEIRQIDGVLHWIGEAGESFPFEVVEGRLLYAE